MDAAVTEHPIDHAARVVGSRRDLAAALGITVAALGNWKARGTPIQYCWSIESLTHGAVTRRELRPDDAHLIWPDLATTEVAAAGEGA